MKRVLLLLLIVLSFAFSGKMIQAAGLGIYPSEFSAKVSVDSKTTFTLEVYNTSAEPGIFRVYADQKEDWFAIEPAEFQLNPDSRQKVKVLIEPKSSGKYIIDLSVVGKSLNKRGFDVASGLKLPVVLTVASAGAYNLVYWYFALLVFILLLAGDIFMMKKLLKQPLLFRMAKKVKAIFRKII